MLLLTQPEVGKVMLENMTVLDELISQLAENITAIEERKRRRTDSETERFIYSLNKILTDVWHGIHIKKASLLQPPRRAWEDLISKCHAFNAP